MIDVGGGENEVVIWWRAAEKILHLIEEVFVIREKVLNLLFVAVENLLLPLKLVLDLV